MQKNVWGHLQYTNAKKVILSNLGCKFCVENWSKGYNINLPSLPDTNCIVSRCVFLGFRVKQNFKKTTEQFKLNFKCNYNYKIQKVLHMYIYVWRHKISVIVFKKIFVDYE